MNTKGSACNSLGYRAALLGSFLCFLALAAVDLTVLPVRADSEASTEASTESSTEAGREAPGLMGRRGRRWRRYGAGGGSGGGGASLYQRQQMMQQRQFQQKQNQDTQRELSHEQQLGQMPDSAFVKDYGGGRNGYQGYRNGGGGRRQKMARWRQMQKTQSNQSPAALPDHQNNQGPGAQPQSLSR